MNFQIKNSTPESSEINLFGEIGESWFSEGITMQSVSDQIKNLASESIILNISSLGGDVNHALAIHDILKTHKAKVTANVIGATASAGTIVALGADEVKMSENALFLVHNAWTISAGNAEDMRKTANDLDTFDSRIVNIYKKKTKKNKAEIEKLMSEEKWITADEAKDFGFIDSVYKPTKALNKADIEKLQNKLLPKLPDNFLNQTDMDNKTFLNKIEEWGKNFLAKIQKEEKSFDTEAAVTEAKNALTTEFKAAFETLNGEKAALETKVKDLEKSGSEQATEIETLKGELAKAKLGNVPDGGASNDSPEEGKEKGDSPLFDFMAKKIKNVHHV